MSLYVYSFVTIVMTCKAILFRGIISELLKSKAKGSFFEYYFSVICIYIYL